MRPLFSLFNVFWVGGAGPGSGASGTGGGSTGAGGAAGGDGGDGDGSTGGGGGGGSTGFAAAVANALGYGNQGQGMSAVGPTGYTAVGNTSFGQSFGTADNPGGLGFTAVAAPSNGTGPGGYGGGAGGGGAGTGSSNAGAPGNAPAPSPGLGQQAAAFVNALLGINSAQAGTNSSPFGPGMPGTVAYGPNTTPMTGNVANFGSGLGFGLGPMGFGDPGLALAYNNALMGQLGQNIAQMPMAFGNSVGPVGFGPTGQEANALGAPAFGYGMGFGQAPNMGFPAAGLASTPTGGYASAFGAPAGSSVGQATIGYPSAIGGNAPAGAASIGGNAPAGVSSIGGNAPSANAPSAFASNMMGVAPPGYGTTAFSNSLGNNVAGMVGGPASVANNAVGAGQMLGRG